MRTAAEWLAFVSLALVLIAMNVLAGVPMLVCLSVGFAAGWLLESEVKSWHR